MIYNCWKLIFWTYYIVYCCFSTILLNLITLKNYFFLLGQEYGDGWIEFKINDKSFFWLNDSEQSISEKWYIWTVHVLICFCLTVGRFFHQYHLKKIFQAKLEFFYQKFQNMMSICILDSLWLNSPTIFYVHLKLKIDEKDSILCK